MYRKLRRCGGVGVFDVKLGIWTLGKKGNATNDAAGGQKRVKGLVLKISMQNP
jgi:hypothetical protein